MFIFHEFCDIRSVEDSKEKLKETSMDVDARFTVKKN